MKIPAIAMIVVATAIASAAPAQTLGADTAATQRSERITAIRVHGNHTTPDADVLAIAALAVGDAPTSEHLADAEARLRASRRFASIEIRRRFESITDPSRILIVLLIDELPGVTRSDPTPGPFKRFRLATVWIPILRFTDGYGFTYGARISLVDKLGPRSRVSTPLTWGGERRAAVEVEHRFDAGPFSMIRAAVAVRRTVNPHYRIADMRQETHLEADRALKSWLRVGGDAGVSQVNFGGRSTLHQTVGGHIVLDTRFDPSFPRNATLLQLRWEHLAFEHGDANRWSSDLRGYVGLIRGSVLALRVQTTSADAALPASEHALLGGSDSLRGYRAGYRAGDGLAAASAEIRTPLNSPFSVGRFGVKGFVDLGAATPYGSALRKQRFDRGVGTGIYFGAAALTAGVDVAWSEQGRGRWHLGMGVTF